MDVSELQTVIVTVTGCVCVCECGVYVHACVSVWARKCVAMHMHVCTPVFLCLTTFA